MKRAALLLAGFLVGGFASTLYAEVDQAVPLSTVSGDVQRAPRGNVEAGDLDHIQGTAPGPCRLNSLCVGPGQFYATLAAAASAARENDVIEVLAGTYRETVKLERRYLTVRGIKGRPHIDCAGIRLVEDKACLLIAADGVTLENLEISGAEISRDLGANAACVRNNRSAGFTLRDIICHDSQEGVLSVGGTIVIEGSQFVDNGWTGLTHNVYLGDCLSVTIRGSLFAEARIGHELKSRCAETRISGSTFRSIKGSRDIDIPDGGSTLVEDSILIKAAGAQSQQILGFTAESCHYPADLVLRNVKIINANPAADIENYGRCDGHAIILDAVSYEGMPVKLIGNIVTQ